MLEKWFKDVYASNTDATFVDATYHWDIHIRPIVIALVDGVKKSLRVPLPKDRPLRDILVHPKTVSFFKANLGHY